MLLQIESCPNYSQRTSIAEGGEIELHPPGSEMHRSLIVIQLLIAVSSAPLLAILMLAAVFKSQTMLDILLQFVAYSFIWAACGVKRDYESRIKLFSKWWWLQLVLICTAVTLARYAYGLSH